MSKYFQNRYLWIPLSILLMSASLWLLSLFFFDNDGWFILNNGRYILEHGIPMKNPFTWMDGLNIIIQQWLWSVITFQVYDICGSWGLAIICIAMYGIALVLYFRICKIHNIMFGRSMIFGTVMLLFMFPFLNIRPTFITIILLLWQVNLLEAYKIDGKWTRLLWLIIISVLEINLHAAIWIFHFVFLLPYLVPEVKNTIITFKKYPMKRSALVLITIPMFLVGFANPYGIRGMMYLFYSYGDDLKSAGIMELSAPATNNIGLVVAGFMIAAVIWISLHRKMELDSSLFYILCGTFLLSLSHTRNAVYFMLGFMLFGIQIMKDLRINYANLHKRSGFVLSFTAFIFAIAVCTNAWKSIGSEPKVEDDSYTPVKAIEYLEEHKIPRNTRLYTTFNQGGYIQWEGYQTFMDPRPELYFKVLNGKLDAFQDYNQMKSETDLEKHFNFINKYDFEWMIVNDNEPIRMYLDLTGKGESVVKGNGYQLYRIV